MAVTWLDSAVTIGSAGGTTLVAAEPTASNGNVLFALFTTSAVTPGGNPQLPSGWTQLYKSSQLGLAWVVGYIQRGGSAPDLTFTNVDTGSTVQLALIMSMESGVGAISLDSQSLAGAGASGAVNPDPPPTEARAESSLAICCGAANAGMAPEFTAPAGYTEHNGVGGQDSAGMAVKSLSAKGVEDPAAFGGTPGAGGFYWHGATVTFTDDPARRWFLGAH